MDYATFEEAWKAILDYINFYNKARPHSGIHNWIPAVFYNCYVGNDTELVIPDGMDLQRAVDARIAQNKAEDKEILEQKYQLKDGAEGQMTRDEERLAVMIRKCRKDITATQKLLDAIAPFAEVKNPAFVKRLRKNIERLESRILFFEEIKGLVLKAKEFFRDAPDDVKSELNDRRTWRRYYEMGYYKKMRGMF